MSKQRSPFEVYADMLGAWGDVVSSWSKSMGGMPFVGVKETEGWFKPFWDYFGDWSKIYQSFAESMKGFSWPYGAMRDYTDAAIKGIDSYVRVYDAWVKSIDKVGRKQFEVAQALASGKEVSTAEIFDTLRQTYADVSVSLAESLRGTALEQMFKGVEEVNKAVKQFADSFPEEEKQAKETFQVFTNSFIKMMNSWNTSIREASRTFSEMLGKGEISPNAYKKVMTMYGEASKESVGVLLGPLSALLPQYKGTVDDMTQWADKYFDLISSWYEVPLKLSQGIAKSSSEMYRFVDETLREAKTTSAEELYSRWFSFYSKTIADLTEATEFSTTLPKFTSNLVEFARSTNSLYQRIMTPPFPSKEEVDRLYRSIEELKKMTQTRERSAGQG
jgi:hypothetical protein